MTEGNTESDDIRELREAAEEGDPSAQYDLAEYYYNRDDDGDMKQAEYWYRQAAEGGDPTAQWCLALIYDEREDYKEASSLFRYAAAQDDEDAAAIFEAVLDTPDDEDAEDDVCDNLYGGADTFLWLRRGIRNGDPNAQYEIGACYASGIGTEQDYEQAVQWYRKAAEQGHSAAQYYLGECYANGYGVDKDPEQAAYWSGKAAAQGYGA